MNEKSKNYLNDAFKLKPEGVSFGIKTGDIHKYKCHQCKEKFKRWGCELDYKYNGHHFCSYNCKRKYLREKGLID